MGKRSGGKIADADIVLRYLLSDTEELAEKATTQVILLSLLVFIGVAINDLNSRPEMQFIIIRVIITVFF